MFRRGSIALEEVMCGSLKEASGKVSGKWKNKDSYYLVSKGLATLFPAVK